MENSIFPTLELHTHRLHELVTGGLTITRVHINVFAPQTLWAVVSITTSGYKETTLFAGEIFFGALKFLRSYHKFLSIRSVINVSFNTNSHII